MLQRAEFSAHCCPSYTSLAFALFSFFHNQCTKQLPEKRSNNDAFFSSSETKSRKNVPPGRGRGRGEAATGFGSVAETTSALVGSSVLAYDAAITYCTGYLYSYQGPVLTVSIHLHLQLGAGMEVDISKKRVLSIR